MCLVVRHPVPSFDDVRWVNEGYLYCYWVVISIVQLYRKRGIVQNDRYCYQALTPCGYSSRLNPPSVSCMLTIIIFQVVFAFIIYWKLNSFSLNGFNKAFNCLDLRRLTMHCNLLNYFLIVSK